MQKKTRKIVKICNCKKYIKAEENRCKLNEFEIMFVVILYFKIYNKRKIEHMRLLNGHIRCQL